MRRPVPSFHLCAQPMEARAVQDDTRAVRTRRQRMRRKSVLQILHRLSPQSSRARENTLVADSAQPPAFLPTFARAVFPQITPGRIHPRAVKKNRGDTSAVRTPAGGDRAG